MEIHTSTGESVMNGKGDKQRPTDHIKWSNNYDNIKWTAEEDEEFDRIQDSFSAQRSVAETRSEADSKTTGQATLQSLGRQRD